MKYSFYNHRSNAKRRGWKWLITFEEFEKLAQETNLLLGSGITKYAKHLDRIDPDKDYTIDNVQVLQNTDNAKKHHQQKKLVYRWESKEFRFVTGMRYEEVKEGDPF